MRIIGTGSAVPKQVVSNDMLSEILDTNDEWIRTRTGIRNRHIMNGETLEGLAAEAARKALENAGISPEELDFIICSNVYSDHMTPAISCIVQGMIGATCPCMDINGACAGFIYSLYTANSFLATGLKKVLVISAETPVKMADWTDRSTCVLFGDAAAAAVVVPDGEEAKFRLTTTSREDVIYGFNPPNNCPYNTQQPPFEPMQMNGQEVYRFVVATVTKEMKKLLEDNGMTPGDVDCYALHQANQRIIDAFRKRMDQPEEKFPSNIAEYGNTSSASLPLLLDELNRAGRLRRGETVAMSAFGSGLVTGTVLMKW